MGINGFCNYSTVHSINKNFEMVDALRFQAFSSDKSLRIYCPDRSDKGKTTDSILTIGKDGYLYHFLSRAVMALFALILN
jgi:hypothetical protein